MAARSVQYLRSLLCCLCDFVSVWAHPFQIPAYLVLHNTQERVLRSGDPDPFAFLPSWGIVRSLQVFHHSEPCSQWPCSRSQRCSWQEWKSHLVQPTHLLLLIQAVLLLCIGRFVSTSIRLVLCRCIFMWILHPQGAWSCSAPPRILSHPISYSSTTTCEAFTCVGLPGWAKTAKCTASGPGLGQLARKQWNRTSW